MAYIWGGVAGAEFSDTHFCRRLSEIREGAVAVHNKPDAARRHKILS